MEEVVVGEAVVDITDLMEDLRVKWYMATALNSSNSNNNSHIMRISSNNRGTTE